MKGWCPSESTAQFSFGCGARRRWKRGVQKGTGVEAGHFGRDGMKGEDIPTVHTHREKAFLGGLKAWSAQRSDDQSTIYCCNSKSTYCDGSGDCHPGKVCTAVYTTTAQRAMSPSPRKIGCNSSYPLTAPACELPGSHWACTETQHRGLDHPRPHCKGPTTARTRPAVV